jgi:DNA-binding NtrC family response regulator
MKRLLIVDDDQCLLDSLHVVFDGLYEVQSALTAEDAGRLLDQSIFDVMLLDIMLPGISGIDFLSVVLRKYSSMPVVMISGSVSIRSAMHTLELGAADYVRKPFDIDELRFVVARTLRMHDLQCRITALERELEHRPLIAEPGEKPMKELIEEFERILIEKALRESGGVQTRAAETLGTTRRILRYRMDKLGLAP